LNVHSLEFPQVSVATQCTVVAPIGKSEPDAGVDTMLAGPEQLSVAMAEKFTMAPFVSHDPRDDVRGTLDDWRSRVKVERRRD
jgi:hypothetical protein